LASLKNGKTLNAKNKIEALIARAQKALAKAKSFVGAEAVEVEAVLA
jgi:hypothetical protein